MVLLDTR
ncbi:hypothetical protein VTH06DRAFT_2960 [Thermothelomyces fergusii]